MTWHLKINTDAQRRDEFKELLKEEKGEYSNYHPPKPKVVFEPEFQSIEVFVQFLLDEGESQYNAEQVEKLSFNLEISSLKVIRQLKSYGLSPESRDNVKKLRGYRSSDNPWASCPGFGGSGADQIMGWAGNKG